MKSSIYACAFFVMGLTFSNESHLDHFLDTNSLKYQYERTWLCISGIAKTGISFLFAYSLFNNMNTENNTINLLTIIQQIAPCLFKKDTNFWNINTALGLGCIYSSFYALKDIYHCI